jgi:hypothetical protein
MITASDVKTGDMVRFSNSYGQVMVGKVIRTYEQYVLVKRDEWFAVEAIDPAQYATFERIAQ